MPDPRKKKFNGPAMFSYGFRPFFLAAILFAGAAVLGWLAAYFGRFEPQSVLMPVDWHIHEMLFGYTAAVITGFLFTAIPNWTGRMPIRGWPLAALVLIWGAGRLVMLGIGGLGPVAVMAVDCAFLLAILACAVREVIAGKNWRNLVVVGPVGMFLLANIWFHLEAMNSGSTDNSRRLGIAVVIFLITLIGGRVIPSFTRNWLVKQKSDALPTAMNRFDGLCLIGGVVGLAAWIGAPDSGLSQLVLAGAAVLHGMRLSRWCGLRTVLSPILFMLHVAYGFVPLGLLTLALNYQTEGVHVLGIGAIGGMTVAVMIRATLGHTGRALQTTPDLVVGFAALPVAALLRVLAQNLDGFYALGILLSGGIWICGFAIILVRVGPWLWSENAQKRMPN